MHLVILVVTLEDILNIKHNLAIIDQST